MNYDIVFHVDLNDEAVLNIAISNITNYFTAIEGQKAEVVMLVNGPAVNLFKKETLMDGVQVVPAGIVELARLQNERYTYIKP